MIIIIKKIIYNHRPTDYTISDEGVVYGKNGKRMKERYMPSGYIQACLRINNKYVYEYIHRLVYQTFVGNIPLDKEINHIDGNKINNSLDNLELVTRDYNIYHSWLLNLAYKHNPHDPHTKEKRLSLNYSDDIINAICKDLEKPDLTYAEIAIKHKIEPALVYQIANGNLWQNISSKYDIKSRIEKRKELYKERDKKIIQLRSDGLKIKDIAEKLNISFDTVARRLYLLRKNNLIAQ